MKLKKLEIHGFKSFNEKSIIEFPDGISAVVGPNGCGKSNIIDALRWVMGEQSVKQLRGKKMEDIIFSGTAGSHQLNMAEVSLTLLNDNGSAPEELKEYTEINLTRKLYRSGESSYLINKRPCRLKDIHNIFLGSGMSSKSYGLMEQGSIGKITEAGPEEKRHFIEEAAGITRYKNRKNEALRKMDLTNQNILRVKDLVAEINRQMSDLQRQAKKAELYNNYRIKIKNLDILLAINKYDSYSERINKTENLLAQLKDSSIAHTSHLKKLDAAIEEIHLRRTEQSNKLSEKKAEKYELQRQIDRHENDLEHLRKDITRLGEDILNFKKSRQEIEKKNQEITREINQTKAQILITKKTVENIHSNLEHEKKKSQYIRDSYKKLNIELETCKSNLMTLMADQARYKNIYQNARNNKEKLTGLLKRANEDEVIVSKKLLKIVNIKKKAKDDLDKLMLETNDLNEEIELIKKEANKKNQNLANQLKTVQSLDLERNNYKSKYNALKKMESNFEWYKDGVKAVMKKSLKVKSDTGEDCSNEKILGLMADIIEPETSFENAVEAVLGESLQYILINEPETGIESIEYLKSTGAGRSGFIPVSSIKSNPAMQTFKDFSQSKMLLHKVKVKKGFEKIISSLLNNIIVADNMEEALKIFNASKCAITVVTKNGNMISGNGIMTGGSKENLSGILAKKQELRILEKKITGLNKKIESEHFLLKELEAEIRKIETKMQKLFERRENINDDRVNAEKTLYRAEEDVKHEEKHLKIIRLEQERLDIEEDDMEEEITRHNKDIKKIEQNVKESQKKVNETTTQAYSVADEIESFDQRIVELKLDLTSLSTKLESSSTTLRRLEEYQEESSARLIQISSEISIKEDKLCSSTEKTKTYKENLSSMYEELKNLVLKLEESMEDLNKIDTSMKEHDVKIAGIKNKHEKVLHDFRLLELECSQFHIKRDNISSNLNERYHKSILELKTKAVNSANSQKNSNEIPVKEVEEKLAFYRKKIDNIKDVNLSAIKEYEQLKSRHDFICKQQDDLVLAINDLRKVVQKINSITKKNFLETFEAINIKLQEVFPRLFEGGAAKLVLSDPDNLLETGVDFMVQPPGKKLTRISLLSGGEKALSAIAFIFSIFLIKPTSFCLMDEIDAPLDEANTYRFNTLLKTIGEKSQIIMITHNRKSMEFADSLFGITMETKGISKIVSVNLN